MVSCMEDAPVAENRDSQQEAASSTKCADIPSDCELSCDGSQFSSHSESTDVEVFSSDSEVPSSCSGVIHSPVQVGDSVVVREGPRIGQTGTVVNNDGGNGIAVQVALSNGIVDWFARSPSHDVSSGDRTDSSNEIVCEESDVGSFNASELESASDEPEVWNVLYSMHQEFKVASTPNKAVNSQLQISDPNQQPALRHSPCFGDGLSSHDPDFCEPPIKRTCVEVSVVDRKDRDDDEATCCLTAVGA